LALLRPRLKVDPRGHAGIVMGDVDWHIDREMVAVACVGQDLMRV